MIPITVLIADDDAGMRLVMRKLVQQAEGYELVGEASDGAELIRLYDAQRPEVVLLDVEMPEMSGIDCARAIQDRDPRTVGTRARCWCLPRPTRSTWRAPSRCTLSTIW